MPRIIAGIAGGRRLAVPSRGTRPTADRVREALFSALTARIDLDGARVLDLYAGSGALGLEALSRGAAHLLAVESDARAAEVAARNIEAVGIDGARVRRASVSGALAGEPDEPYDLVLADPPYVVTDVAVTGVLESLVLQRWLAPDAVVVVERSSRSPKTRWPFGLAEEWSKNYGEARIEIARTEERSTD